MLAHRAHMHDIATIPKTAQVRHRSVMAAIDEVDGDFENVTPETRKRLSKEHRKLFVRDNAQSDSSRTSTSGSSDTELGSDELVSSSSEGSHKQKTGSDEQERKKKKKKRKSRKERAHRRLALTKSSPSAADGETTETRAPYERSMSVPIGVRFDSYGSVDAAAAARRRRHEFVSATKTANAFEDGVVFNPCATIFGDSDQSLLSPSDVDVTDVLPVVELSPKMKAKVRPSSLAPVHEEDGASSSSLQSPTQSPPALVVEGSENVAYSASEQSSIRTAATPTDESRDTATSVCESEVNTVNCLNKLNS